MITGPLSTYYSCARCQPKGKNCVKECCQVLKHVWYNEITYHSMLYQIYCCKLQHVAREICDLLYLSDLSNLPSWLLMGN